MASLFDSKRNTILKYAGFYGCSTFVETGTGGGDMLDAVYPYFKQAYSMELDPGLFAEAKNRFSGASSVKLYLGDSSRILPAIMPLLKGLVFYYLDAHYSGGFTAQGSKETPIQEELEAILSVGAGANAIILIDDLADFYRNPAYPKPADLKVFIDQLRPGMDFEILKEGGGMLLVTPAKKKRDEKRKLVQVVEKVAAGAKVSEAKPFEPRTFERPPMLYGPYREGKKKEE